MEKQAVYLYVKNDGDFFKLIKLVNSLVEEWNGFNVNINGIMTLKENRTIIRKRLYFLGTCKFKLESGQRFIYLDGDPSHLRRLIKHQLRPFKVKSIDYEEMWFEKFVPYKLENQIAFRYTYYNINSMEDEDRIKRSNFIKNGIDFDYAKESLFNKLGIKRPGHEYYTSF